MIVHTSIREFFSLVEKEKNVERLECSNQVVKTHGDGSSRPKKGNCQKKPYNRPQQNQGGLMVSRVGNQGVKCYICGRPHYASQCAQKEVIYYKRQKLRHIARNFQVVVETTPTRSAIRV